MEFSNLTDFDLQNDFDEIEKLLRNSNFSVSDFSVLPQIPTEEKVIKIVTYVLAILIAFCANLLVIVVIICTKSLRTRFNMFVLNLAMADLLVPMTCMWLHLVTNLNPTKWLLGTFFCRINTFMQVLVVSVSILTLTVSITDRFAAAVYPRMLSCTQGHQVTIIILIWMFGTLLSLPWLLYTHLTELNWFGKQETLCQAHFPSEASRQAYTTVFAVAGFLVPVVVMFILIGITMKKVPPATSMTFHGGENNADMRRKALNMLFTVLVVFFLCWSPLQFLRLWDVFRTRSPHTKLPEGIHSLMYASYYLAYFSSCINPLLYIAFNKCFRHAVLQCLKRKPKQISISVVPVSFNEQSPENSQAGSPHVETTESLSTVSISS